MLSERAAQDEQDVRGVDMDELLLRVLAAALRRHAGLRALHDLQQRLLHALARHVARDGQVLGLAGHLVDLVDVDDADLGARDIEVGRGHELEQDVLHILAHVARLGEGGGVGDGERHAQRAGQRLRKQRLARARGTQKHDVALRQLHVTVYGVRAQADALVVVVHRHRQRALRLLLTHHVLGELGVQLVGRGQVGQHVLRRRIGDRSRHDPVAHPRVTALLGVGEALRHRCLVMARNAQPQVAHHGIGAHGDALVADVDAVRPRYHGRHLMRLLAAEGAGDIGVSAFEFVVASVVHVSCSLLYSSVLGATAREVVMRSTRP